MQLQAVLLNFIMPLTQNTSEQEELAFEGLVALSWRPSARQQFTIVIQSLYTSIYMGYAAMQL